MIGLPIHTEVNKQLPKNAIYQRLGFTSAQKDNFDADISRIYIANELSPETINIQKGERIESIFVLRVQLKKRDYSDKNIVILSKLLPHNIVYVLEHEEQYSLAIYHTKLLKSLWTSEPTLNLTGLSLDVVWENIVKDIGGYEVEAGNSLEQQIEIDERREKMLKQIALLEKKMHKAKQFNEQVKIKNEIKKLREGLK